MNASALVYTMVEMARAHDLNIYGYLQYLLEQCPDQGWTDEQLADPVPWSEKLQHLKNLNYSELFHLAKAGVIFICYRTIIWRLR